MNLTAEETKRRGLRPAVLIGGLLIAAIVAAVVVFMARGGDESMSIASRYKGPNTDLVYLYGYDGSGGLQDVSYVRFGSDERPIEVTDAPYGWATLLPGRGNVLSAGGPLIGITSEDELAVVSVNRDTGEVSTLLDGGDDYAAYYDTERDQLAVIEYRASGSRCYVGRVDEQLRRVARGDRCWFSGDGSYVLSAERDNDEYEYEVFGIDGIRLLAGDSIREPLFGLAPGYLVTFQGSVDRYSIRILEIETGELVAESSRGVEVVELASDGAGRSLVASRSDDGEAILELLDPSGTVTELLANEGPIAAGFLTEDGSDMLVMTTTEDGDELSVAAIGSDGTVDLQSIAGGSQIQVVAPPEGERDGRYLAVASGDGADAVVYVDTEIGVIEVDIDDFGSLGSVLLSADRDRLFAEIGTATDGEFLTSLLTVDLRSGEATWLIEEWSSIDIADIRADGTGVAVVGREQTDDNDQAAAIVDLAGAVELVDEGPRVSDVRYVDDESRVLLTIADGDVDTFEYEIGSRTQPTLLYRDAAIAFAGWDNQDRTSAFGSIARLQVPLPAMACRDFFPGFEIVTIGGLVSRSIEPFESANFCLSVDAAASVTVVVESSFDSKLDVEGPFGSPVNGIGVDYYSNDDFNGIDAGLELFLQPGAYSVSVSGFDTSSGEFALRVDQ